MGKWHIFLSGPEILTGYEYAFTANLLVSDADGRSRGGQARLFVGDYRCTVCEVLEITCVPGQEIILRRFLPLETGSVLSESVVEMALDGPCVHHHFS